MDHHVRSCTNARSTFFPNRRKYPVSFAITISTRRVFNLVPIQFLNAINSITDFVFCHLPGPLAVCAGLMAPLLNTPIQREKELSSTHTCLLGLPARSSFLQIRCVFLRVSACSGYTTWSSSIRLTPSFRYTSFLYKHLSYRPTIHFYGPW